MGCVSGKTSDKSIEITELRKRLEASETSSEKIKENALLLKNEFDVVKKGFL